MNRKSTMPEGSYTTYLFEKGQDKILKKLGEECAEIIIGAKSNDRENTIYECGDFIYHLLVLLAEKGITPGEIFYELEKRKK